MNIGNSDWAGFMPSASRQVMPVMATPRAAPWLSSACWPSEAAGHLISASFCTGRCNAKLPFPLGFRGRMTAPLPSQEAPMQVQDLMTRDVGIISPDETLKKAACRMAELDVGVLPVAEGDRLVGMITDRDMVVRGIADDLGPSALVRDVM